MLIKIVKKQLLTLYDWMAEVSHYSKYSFAICSSLPPIAPLVCPLKLCITFFFLLGVTVLPREMKDRAYAKFWGANKVYYGEYNICVCPCLAAVYCKARNHAWTFFNSKTSLLFSFFVSILTNSKMS